MEIIVRWMCRLATVLVATLIGALSSATAWAAPDRPAVAVGETLAKGKIAGLVGGLGALCCLLVVGAIVLAVVMIGKRRR